VIPAHPQFMTTHHSTPVLVNLLLLHAVGRNHGFRNKPTTSKTHTKPCIISASYVLARSSAGLAGPPTIPVTSRSLHSSAACVAKPPNPPNSLRQYVWPSGPLTQHYSCIHLLASSATLQTSSVVSHEVGPVLVSSLRIATVRVAEGAVELPPTTGSRRGALQT
jgi:hypothetical protein